MTPNYSSHTLDFEVERHGNLFLVQPMTGPAGAWLDENVDSETWMHMGTWLAVDQHCMADLARGMVDAGFRIGGAL